MGTAKRSTRHRTNSAGVRHFASINLEACCGVPHNTHLGLASLKFLICKFWTQYVRQRLIPSAQIDCRLRLPNFEYLTYAQISRTHPTDGKA